MFFKFITIWSKECCGIFKVLFAILFFPLFCFGQVDSIQTATDAGMLSFHRVPEMIGEVSVTENKEVNTTTSGWFLPSYKAQGFLNDYWISEGTPTRTNLFYFSVAIGREGCWNCVLKNHSNISEVFYLQCDGTNTYSLSGALDIPESSRERVGDADDLIALTALCKMDDGEPVKISSGVQLLKGCIPTSNNKLGLLWMVFLSGNYLQTNSFIPNLLEVDPLKNPASWSTRFIGEIDKNFQLLNSGLFVVDLSKVSLDLIDYQELIEPENKSLNQWVNEKLHSLRSIPDGTLRASYLLNKVKDIDDQRVPILFSAAILPEVGVPTKENCGELFIGQVTNIIVRPPAMLKVPQIQGEVFVWDNRFMMRNETNYRAAILYKTTNEWILDKTNPRILKMGMQYSYPRFVKDVKLENNTGKKDYFWPIVIVLVLAILIRKAFAK